MALLLNSRGIFKKSHIFSLIPIFSKIKCCLYQLRILGGKFLNLTTWENNSATTVETRHVHSVALGVGRGCVNRSATMTQAWDHRRLPSLTEKADNGRSHGDGEYQLLSRYQLQVMPSRRSNCGQCTLTWRSNLSDGFLHYGHLSLQLAYLRMYHNSWLRLPKAD